MFKCVTLNITCLLLSISFGSTLLQGINSTRSFVGWNASFRFLLITWDYKTDLLRIANPNQTSMMLILDRLVNYTDDYKNRIEFTGNTSAGLITFILRNSTLGDAGKYTAGILGNDDLGEQTLIVIASPSKPQIEAVTPAVSGTKYTLRFSSQSSSAPHEHGLTMMYDWIFRRNGHMHTPGERYTFHNNELTITAIVYEQDNGVSVSCIAFEDQLAKSVESTEHILDVQYGPANVKIIGSAEVTEGERLDLSCSGDCNPPCDSYQWLKDSQHTSRGPSMVNDFTGRDDAGIYTCNITNTVISNSSTAQITVTVNYGPGTSLTIHPSTTHYRNIEGTFIPNISCSAKCNPPCYYQWIGPQKTISGSSLSLGPLNRSVRGTYLCTAFNPRTSAHGNGTIVQVDVLYGPDTPHLSPNTAVYTMLEGQSVSDINCSSDCFPACIQTWRKGVKEFEGNNKGILTLGQVYRDNAANYSCYSCNTESNATGNVSIKLVVQYPPDLTIKATNVSHGDIIVVNCTASGVPDDYIFYKWIHIAPDINRTIVRELEMTKHLASEISFTIEGATYQDSGFYVCKASNGIKHYSTGQLIMENMVSVWIADQPIITYTARYFDAEKGKSCHMHVSFYSGILEPTVIWYRLNNFTMEPVHNSSDVKSYISAAAVKVKYHNTTVQLQGYDASLEILHVGEEHFTVYKVEINNSIAEAVNVTLELRPRGPPETPTNLSVVPKSVTTDSLQLTWIAGFHGGSSQTFVIEYRVAGEIKWLNISQPQEFPEQNTVTTTITDLKDGTQYEFRIYSMNAYYWSQTSTTINATTETVKKDELVNPDGSPLVIGAATGSTLVLLVAVAIIGIIFYKRKQSIKSPELDKPQVEKSLRDRHENELVDNPVYDNSGPLPDPSTIGGVTVVEYAAVVKPKRNVCQVDNPFKLYAQVNKTNKEIEKGQVKEKNIKNGKTARGDIYENVTLVGGRPCKKSNLVNSQNFKTDENVCENAFEEPTSGSRKYKDCLLYVDLKLETPITRNGNFVIRGLENRTEYADIAFGKRGDHLPASDDENELNGAIDKKE